MPKGIAKAGFRKQRADKGKKRGGRRTADIIPMRALTVSKKFETDAQIDARIKERFEVLQILTDATLRGDSRALIVSGPAGLGKSYTVEAALKTFDPNGVNNTIIKGFVKATGLYKLLYDYREAGQVITFDDADSIFYDDVALNMLKAVCDTNEVRRVSYLSEGTLFSEKDNSEIPKQFEFNGSIVFITNLDFDHLIERGHKLAPHLQALLSRAHYVSMGMQTRRDYIIRIKQVIYEGLFDNIGLFTAERDEVIDFIEENAETMRELSLRSAMKLAALRKTGGKHWKNISKITNLRGF